MEDNTGYAQASVETAVEADNPDVSREQVPRYTAVELHDLSLNGLQDLATREGVDTTGDKGAIVAGLLEIYDDVEEDSDGDMKMGVDKCKQRYDMAALKLLSLSTLQTIAQKEEVDAQGNKDELLKLLGQCYEDSQKEELYEGDVDMVEGIATPLYDIEELKTMSLPALKKLATANGLPVNCGKEEIRVLLSELIEAEGEEDNITDNDSAGSRNKENRDLEDALLSWKVTNLRELLARLRQPLYGTKSKMVDRILCNISIDDAVTLLRRHRESLQSDDDEYMGNTKNCERGVLVQEKRKLVDGDGEDSRARRSPRNPAGQSFSTIGRRGKKLREGGSVMEQKQQEVVGNDEGWVYNGNDSDSVQTEHVNNVHKTRIGLMVTAPPSSTEPDKKLVLQLQHWFAKMQESDKNFSLLPWSENDSSKVSIKKMQDIPTKISKLRLYFTRARANTSGGRVNMDVQVLHTVPIADLRGDAEWFLEENNMAIYDKKLQVEATSQLGWLLYSTQSMDQDVLANQIQQAIGVKLALRWKFINTSKFISDATVRKKWMALHVEVDAKEAKKAARGLAKFYSSSSVSFPLGIRMRLVAEFRDVKGNPIMMAKHARLRARQASFISVIAGHPNDDIMLLDHKVNGKSLRDMIMQIKSFNPDTPGTLFHSVGQNWKGRYIFNFLQSKASEAAMIVDGIIPYLFHYYGRNVHQFFDPGAVTEKEDWVWDAKNNTVINPLSKELDGLGGMDADFDFTVSAPIVDPHDSNTEKVTENIAPTTAAALASNRLNLVLNGIDNDSISTLGNPTSPTRTPQTPSLSVIEMPSPTSGSSVNSGITLDSRVSAIESQISTMQATIVEGVEAKLETKLDAFLTKLMAAQSASQLPGGEIAGRPNV